MNISFGTSGTKKFFNVHIDKAGQLLVRISNKGKGVWVPASASEAHHKQIADDLKSPPGDRGEFSGRVKLENNKLTILTLNYFKALGVTFLGMERI